MTRPDPFSQGVDPQGTDAGARSNAWRTRDIVVAAVLAVAFGVFFWAFGVAWSALGVLGPTQNVLYGLWLLPAIVVPLIVRKPGAALFAETVAAALSALLGAQWGLDTLLSGVMQGAAAELVFALARYRRYDAPVVVAASLASMAAAFVHDWWFYYQATSVDVVLLIGLFMALSGLLFLPAAAIALVRSLRRTGVLEGFPA
jgi:energy-coupling factor transport system substrate-specific component